jgi:hypothetical protein
MVRAAKTSICGWDEEYRVHRGTYSVK